MSREQRRAWIDWTCEDLLLSQQAQLLSLDGTGLYYRPVLPSKEEIALKHRIDEIYAEHLYYRSRRITEQLRWEDHQVNRKAVMRHMNEMGLAAVYPGPNLSKRACQVAIYLYLLVNVTADYPNHVWGLDITYIRLRHGWLYLVAVLDWYSRYVVSWELDQTNQPSGCLDRGGHFSKISFS